MRAGKLRLWGGASHPEHDWGGSDYSWSLDLADYVDERTYRVRLQATLSTDPNQGVIDAWVDGRHVVRGWRPVSRTGRRPGTIVPEQSQLMVRSGLYRGTDAPHATPTYEQWLQVRLRELT